MDGNHPEHETIEVPAVRKTIEGLDIILPNAKEVCQMTGKDGHTGRR